MTSKPTSPSNDLQRLNLPICPPPPGMIDLCDVTAKTVEYADKAVAWYTERRRPKKRFMGLLRYGAILLTGLAGVTPVIIAMWPGEQRPNVLWASIFIAIAAMLVAIDRFGDLSRGWIRYMVTSFRIIRLQNAFLFKWSIARSEWAQGKPDPAQIASWLRECQAFVEALDGIVQDETAAWSTEFQASMQQFDAELERMRSDRLAADREIVSRQEEQRRSSAVNVFVPPANQPVPGWFVEVEGQRQSGNASGRLGFTGVRAGLVAVRLYAKPGDAEARASKVITVPAGALVDVELN